MIHHSRESVSTAPESNCIELTLGIVRGVLVLTLLPEALSGAVLSACVAYYFTAEPLLSLDVST